MNENALLTRKVSIRRTHTQSRVHGAIAKRGNAQTGRGRENLLLDPFPHTPPPPFTIPPPKKPKPKTKPKNKNNKETENNVKVKGHFHPEIKIVHI